jgi:hypothetical protein
MKKLLTVLILLLTIALTFSANSQSFEGTIHWSMKMEVTDPATKAKMDEAQRKMNDPATQKKMKEMQAQMNDPKFKAMMENNPQMKAQMEAAMKMMGGGDMSSMMPSGMLVKIKNDNSVTIMEGGMMDKMEMLYLKDKNQSVRLDRANKTYTVMSSATNSNQRPEPKVTKTTETKKILDHLCTKYIVESITPNGKPSQQIFWTTTDLKIDMKNLAQQRMGKGNAFFYENIEGVPLRIEMTMPEVSMTMEATAVKKETQNASDFQIPADFKEVKGPGF